jgi:hypothetical protein
LRIVRKKGCPGRLPVAVRACAVCLCAVLLAGFATLAGCGGGNTPTLAERRAEVEQAATQFLDACGNQDAAAVLSCLSAGYLEANGLGESLSREDLQRALGTFISYRFDPSSDIVVDQERGLVTVYIDYGTFGTKEETLVLVREDGLKVDNFTAMRWNTAAPPADTDQPNEAVAKSLRSFVEACVKGNTEYLFKNLTTAYKEAYRLSKAWTAAEFAGIFGEARGYQFDQAQIRMNDQDHAEVDVTIDFGSRGNLEKETARVSLAREGGIWKVDGFPFFLY